MTATAAHPTTIPGRKSLGEQVARVLTTTDHKLIGKLYLITSFAWFMVGGLMAMLIRSELAYPGMQVVNEELYNQLFTMHGTIMLLLFATPLFFGFGNVIMPLQIGSPDVIHDFGIPGFLMKMDVVPGRVNHYAITPTVEGEYAGKCYELCGVYHSRMLFTVKVVSQEEYDAYVADLVAAGRTSELPLLGGDHADTQVGLESGEESEEGAE